MFLRNKDQINLMLQLFMEHLIHNVRFKMTFIKKLKNCSEPTAPILKDITLVIYYRLRLQYKLSRSENSRSPID